MMGEPCKSPLEMFYQWEKSVPEQVFLRQSSQESWREFTWAEFADRVRRLAGFIRSQDFEPGSKIAILSANCADWMVVDLAIMLSGHISVPLYPGQDLDSARYILDHSEARMVFVGKFDQAAEADALLGEDLLRVAIHGCTLVCDYSLEELAASWPPEQGCPVPDLDDIFTIIYTSGTTGNPKGVMHAFGTPAKVVARRLHLITPVEGERERLMCYLTLAHVAERCGVEMRALYNNSVVAFSDGPDSFAAEMREVRPTMFFAVPRLWEKFKAAIDARYAPSLQADFGESEKAQVRKMLGLDRAEWVTTGSAPTPRHVQQWFLDMGIRLRDAYGATENFIDGCFDLADGPPCLGCVGKPLPGVELKLSDSGEVCFRSDGLMKGYFKDPQKTAEVLIDGWYHTGDSGIVDEQGRLKLVGRISENFKTGKGKFINPDRLEKVFGGVAELEQLCVFGHGESQPLLLANLSAAGKSLSREALYARLLEVLTSINASLPSYERVAAINLTGEEWTSDNGLLTPTMKIKRRAVVEKYQPLIERCKGNAAILWLE